MTEYLKLSVGYQLPDRYSISEVIAEYRTEIAELYFPFQGMPDGRGMSLRTTAEQREMEEELREIAGMGVRLDLLLNANCYGAEAVSGRFASAASEMLRYLIGEFNLSVVTTTSLFIARLCRREFPELEVRASVNMGINSPEAVRYVADYFDSFYVAREHNRFPEKIREMRLPGKKFHLLANSGCLRNCSAHTFHDNLVAHEGEVEPETPNAWPNFRGICWEYYAKKENRNRILADSSWIRPEEIDCYSGLVDGIKLATRTNPRFGGIIQAYAERTFSGNILALCEPDFSGLIYADNKSFPAGWHQIAACPDSPAYHELCNQVLHPAEISHDPERGPYYD